MQRRALTAGAYAALTGHICIVIFYSIEHHRALHVCMQMRTLVGRPELTLCAVQSAPAPDSAESTEIAALQARCCPLMVRLLMLRALVPVRDLVLRLCCWLDTVSDLLGLVTNWQCANGSPDHAEQQCTREPACHAFIMGCMQHIPNTLIAYLQACHGA